MELSNDFEDKLREAMLDEIEGQMIGQEANLAYQFVELVHTRLRAYGERHGYDVEETIDSLGTPEVTRSGDRITVRVGWDSEQMARWEFGVSEHTIDGDPLLSFVWEDPPRWVRQEFDQARGGGGQFESGWRVFLPEVDHPGIPESRAIRDSLHAFRRVVES
ncbi:MAG: hypothetical protein RI568_13665 [Natronomonas sp.]|uniref:hypothetical protein n=1 Tax=Natronomonas sp. TaxID=2184060 RepID=UPI002870981D|nr:hypothetical protein [Natronomonas sp.]MDR9431730.1 hypothetical protein [Natronomonas sp.]